MLALFQVAALTLANPAISPEALAVVAPVREAIEAAEARQEKLPAPKDDADRLIRMLEVDQAGREVITRLDFSKVPGPERPAAARIAGDWLKAVDRRNEAALLAMLPPEGWFYRSRYGDRAAMAAFLIVQHSHADLWRRFLPVLEPLVGAGEVEGQAYGALFDRAAVAEGRPQRYGSQFRCEGGALRPYPLEDEGRVEHRRREMGFPISFAETTARMAAAPPCAVPVRAQPEPSERRPDAQP